MKAIGSGVNAEFSLFVLFKDWRNRVFGEKHLSLMIEKKERS